MTAPAPAPALAPVAGSNGRLDRLDTTAVLLLVGCCTLWGLGQVAAKVGLQGIPPLLQASLRALGASVPVAGLAFGVLLLGEPLTGRLLVGVAAVAAGLWLINRR